MPFLYRCHCGQWTYGEGASCSGESRVVMESYVDADSSEGRDRARVRSLAIGLLCHLGANRTETNVVTIMDWIRGVESDAEERGAQEAIDNYEPEPPERDEC